MAIRHSIVGTTSDTFQIGKGGSQVKNNSGVLEARNSGDTAYASIQVDSLITDQLTIEDNVISTTNTNANIELDPAGTGYVDLIGTGAIKLNTGTTGERPSNLQGLFRYNTSLNIIEWNTGSGWNQPDTGGGEANQNAYQVVAGDTGTATADNTTDTITIAGGAGTGITTTASDGPQALDLTLAQSTLTDTASAGADNLIFFDATDSNNPKRRSITNFISDNSLAVLGSITLGTDTTGNYMVDVSGTTNEIEVTHTPAEGSTATIGLPDEVIITTGLSVGGSAHEVWDATYDYVQVGGLGAVSSLSSAAAGQATYLTNNAYFDDTDNRWEYYATASDEATRMELVNGTLTFSTATAGTQDTAITWNTISSFNSDQTSTFHGNILASADSSHDIGTTGVRFANGYFDTVHGDGSNLTALTAANISSGNLGSGVLPYVNTDTANSDYKVVFANHTGTTAGNYALLQDSAATFTYNPSTDTLTAGTFSGTATTATNINTTDETTDTTTFVVFVNSATGSQVPHTNSNLTYNSNTGSLTIGGDLTVNGTTTTIDTATLQVEDPLISLARLNNTTDTVDIGLYGLYDTSGSQDLYAGLFRDATDNKWKLYVDSQAEPTTTVNTGATGHTVATLVANLEGNITVADTTDTTTFPVLVGNATGSEAPLTDGGLTYNASTANLSTTTFTGALSGNASTATALETSRTFSATGDVTATGQSFDGTGNVALPMVANFNNLTTDATGGASGDFLVFVDVSDSNLTQKVLVSDFLTNTGATDSLARRSAVGTAASTNIGAVLPSNAYVTRVVVDITTAYDNSSVMTVSAAGGVTALAVAADIDPQVIGTYVVDLPVSGTSTGQITADLTLSPTVGASTVFVEYRIIP